MYTLDGLISEVARKRGKASKEGNIDYREVWHTYMRYLTSVLESRKGLNVSTFAKIGWQQDHKSKYRPYFQLADQFARAYVNPEGCRPSPSDRTPCPFEEFNFSKAAIKFSNQLTKDQVFTGLRAMLQQLGEAIAGGRDADVEFPGVGKFQCREKEPRFHFAQDWYVREGLEAPPQAIAVSEEGQRAVRSFTRDAPIEAMNLGIRGSNKPRGGDARQPPPRIPETNRLNLEDENDYPDPTGYGRGFSPTGSPGRTPGGFNQQPPITPGMMSSSSAPSLRGQAQSPSSRNHVLTNAQFKREVAFKEAMDRHIGEMEARAQEAMGERQAWHEHVNMCMEQERDDITTKRMRAMENKHFIQQQKRLNAERRKGQRHEDIVAASAHEFPKFTEPAEKELKDFQKGQQQKMRSDLDEQVRTNSTLRNLAKQRERAIEINQLEANRNEMQMLRDAERAKKAYDKEALATAWNSEIRMKNIWKAIDNHNKVGSHPPSSVQPDLPPSRAGSIAASTGRLLTGSSRRVPMGASNSLANLQGQFA